LSPSLNACDISDNTELQEAVASIMVALRRVGLGALRAARS
jgi:hypothetical protein